MFYSVELYLHTQVIVERMVFINAFVSCSSPIYTWLVLAYIFVIIGLGSAALRRHALGKKNWWIPVIPLILIILPVALQTTLVYEIRVNQTDIIVNEPIEVDVVLRNPTPFWIWSNGYRGLSLFAIPEGTHRGSSEAIGYSASAPLERGLVKPFEERIIGRRKVTHNETGPLKLGIVVGNGKEVVNTTRTILVGLDPFLVDQVQLNPNGAKLPFMMFEVTNQGECAIVQLNAKVDNNIIPWSFGVDHDNRLGVEEKTSFKVYTQWYDPTQKEIVGFTPQQGFPYKVTVKARYEDGETRTRTIDVIADQHSYLTTIGVDTVQVGDTSLLTTKDYSTLAFSIENGWTDEENLRLSKIHVYLNSSRVMVVDKWVPFGGELAVSSILEDKLETGDVYNVTIVSLSTTGEISKNTEFIRCEPYIVQRIHLLY